MHRRKLVLSCRYSRWLSVCSNVSGATDKHSKRYFSVPLPRRFPPDARGWGRSSRRKAPSRAALPGRRWELLQTPPNRRKEPHYKRLFFGKSSQKARGDQGDGVHTDGDDGTSARDKPRSGRMSAPGRNLTGFKRSTPMRLGAPAQWAAGRPPASHAAGFFSRRGLR